jgi:hypothetical protein
VRRLLSVSILRLSSNDFPILTKPSHFLRCSARLRAVSSTSTRMWTRVVLVLAATASLACGDRKTPASVSDSSVGTRTPSTPDSVRPVITASGWDSTAGTFIVLPTVDGGMQSGSMLRADASEQTVGDTAGIGRLIADTRIELFSRAGRVGLARVAVDAAPRMDAGCTAWPIARLTLDGSGGPGSASAPQWTAAFAANRVSAVPLDSIEGLASRDSVRLATDLARLASGLRDDSTSTFRGLPFVVLRAYRTRGLDTAFIVATLARRVNQEADPREERLVLVVDVVGDDARKWTVAWHERASGREDELVVAEPLLAFRTLVPKGTVASATANTAANTTTNTNEVRLLFGRDDGVALGAAVLARGRKGWHVLWESAVAGCN